MIENHYGYGLRNDEKPFAHKIPPGSYWKSLSHEDKLVFWNGRIPTSGGSTNGLRKRDWNEPAGTITTSPLQKLSCQLHPGYDFEGRAEMVGNHHEHSFDNVGKSGRADFRRKDWDEPSYVVDTTWRINYLHPGERTGEYEYMGYNPLKTLESNGLSVVELFAGGGLMAVGLKTAGYNIIWANDFQKPQCEAYAYNIGAHVVHGDITAMNIDDIPDSDIIAGGPPCQDFSVAGKNKGEQGDKGKLVWKYLEIIDKKQPKAFIFENVKGLVGAKHIHTFNELVSQFNNIGYNVSHKVICSWDYGVAQKRFRVFIVGIRKDLGIQFQFPEPIKEDYQTQTIFHAIGDLPEPEMQFKNGRLTKISEKTWEHDRRHKEKGTGLVLRVQEQDEPSLTIDSHTGHGSSANLHWESRRFTVRECLRLQSVPDWYVIPDTVSLSRQYEIVGNGVSSKVAWYLGKALAEQLKNLP